VPLFDATAADSVVFPGLKGGAAAPATWALSAFFAASDGSSGAACASAVSSVLFDFHQASFGADLQPTEVDAERTSRPTVMAVFLMASMPRWSESACSF
jgi:hypothetical protein